MKGVFRVFWFVCIFSLPTGVAAAASATKTAPKAVRKDCGQGVMLRLSSASAAQGELLQAEVAGLSSSDGAKAEFNAHEIPMWQEEKALRALIGIDLELAPGSYDWKLSWTPKDGQPASCIVAVTVRAGKFATERLTVEKQYVQPDPEQQKRAEEDQKKMKAIFDTVTPEILWKGPFRVPLKGVTTGGNFGRRRVLNGEARSPHTGVDFPAQTGTPVYAAQSGKVVLAENLYYAGNTVVIDHGYGIYTLYAHLSKIGVKPGDAVESSSVIGKVGATGRVTGPHLHWGLTIDHARVNGLRIVQKRP